MSEEIEAKPVHQGMLARLSPNVKAALITIAATIELAVCGGLYTVGYQNGSRDYDFVKQFRDVDLPKLLSELAGLTSKLRENDTLEKELAHRSAELERAKGENSSKSLQLTNAQEEIKLKSEYIHRIEAELIQLTSTEEEVVSVVKGASSKSPSGFIRISLQNVYVSGSITVQINSRSVSMMKVGEYVSEKIGSKEAKVIFTKITGEEAEFTISYR